MKSLWKPRNLIWLVLLPLAAWALHDIPFSEVWAALSHLKPASILALVVFNFAILLFFNSRWWLILRAQGYRLPYLSLVCYRLGAFAIAYFTPGMQFGGEPLQIYMLQNRHRLPGATALAAVTLDKIFELLANFTFLAFGVILVLNSGLFAGFTRIGSFFIIIGLLSLPLGYLLTLWAGRYPLTWIVNRLPARLARLFVMRRVIPLVASTERQISELCRHKPGTILAISVLSGLMWVLLLAEYWLTLKFLGLELNLLQATGALTAARIAFLTPLPGGLGALEASQVFAMQALGLNPALGISISLLIRARDVALGSIGLWWIGMRPRLSPTAPLTSQAGD